MAYIDDLIAARDNYATKLLALSADSDHHVSHTIDGRSFKWTEYGDYLRKQVRQLTIDIDELGDEVVILETETYT